jgi:hypothetical protein
MDITKQDPPHHFRSYIYYILHTSPQDNNKVLRYWNIFSEDPYKAAANTAVRKFIKQFYSQTYFEDSIHFYRSSQRRVKNKHYFLTLVSLHNKCSHLAQYNFPSPCTYCRLTSLPNKLVHSIVTGHQPIYGSMVHNYLLDRGRANIYNTMCPPDEQQRISHQSKSKCSLQMYIYLEGRDDQYLSHINLTEFHTVPVLDVIIDRFMQWQWN